jgi:phage baseplate assembly protein W
VPKKIKWEVVMPIQKKIDRGITFPFGEGPEGISQSATGIELKKMSIMQILMTAIFERVMRPDYGSRIHELVFEHDKNYMESIIKEMIPKEIKAVDPSVEVVNITLEYPYENQVDVLIDFEYKGIVESVKVSVEKGQ